MNSKKEWSVVKMLVTAVSTIIVLLIGYAIVLYWYPKRIDECGQFGDQFGAMNALFSGLAFAALIATIVLQNRELKEQREDLRLTREEFSKSAEAQKELVEAQLKTARIYGLSALVSAQIPFVNASLDPHVGVVNINAMAPEALKLLEKYCQEIKNEFRAVENSEK